jgi:hypothetical protein
MNSRRGSDDRDVTSHGPFRLFHFKSEIAKCLLRKPKLRQLPIASVSSVSDDNESDEENEPQTKKAREVSSSITKLIQYDGSVHWPVFISAVSGTRCKSEKCSGQRY